MKINRPFLQRLAGWSVLVLVPLLLFAKPILRGEILIPSDILPVIDDVWAAKVTPNNPLLSDIVLQFYPWQKFAAQTIANGQLPLWNPYMMAGAPFLANDQSALFEPLKLLALLTRFPVEQSFLFIAVGRLVLFGFFTAWWLRLRGFPKSVAVIIGAAGMLSAPAMAWLSYPLFATFLWLPLILVGLEYLGRHERRGWLITSGAIAAQWFSGNIQISIFILLFAAAYVVFLQRPGRRVLLLIFFTAILGTGIAAVQLLPTINYVRQSPVFESGRGGYGETNIFTALRDGSWRGWTSRNDMRASLERLLPIVSPFVNGNPASGHYRFPGGNVYANMNELAGSAGAMILFFAILGLLTNWRDRLVKFTAGTSVIVLGMIAHAPIFELLNTLPLLQQTQTDRLRFILVFCLLALGAFGLRAIIDRQIRWQKLTITAGIIILSLAGLGWKVGIGSDWKKELVAFSIGAILLTVGTWRKISDRQRIVRAAFVALIGPLVLWTNYNTSVDIRDVTTTPVLETLQSAIKENERIVSFGIGRGRTPLEPNTAMVYDLLDVRGYDVVRLKRYDELIDDVLTRSGSHLKGAAKPSEILNVLSVRYGLVATRDLATLDPVLRGDGWKVVTEDDKVRLYENAKWQPRAWFTSNVQEVIEATASLAAVRAETFSAGIPVVETGKNIPAETEGLTAPVLINYSDPNEVSITVKARQSGYVILADAFAEGWIATIDDEPTEILPMNHALRAVKTSRGEHTIVFRYQPKDFSLGLAISLVSMLVISIFFWRSKKVFGA